MSKVTTTLLQKIFPSTPKAKLDRFVSHFNSILPKYGITTKLRFAAFIANVGIESDRLKTTREYGETSYFNRYNNRKDLGNIRAGDGPRYRGRSILQTTGRFNYWKVVVAYLKVLTGKDWNHPLAHTNFDAYLNSEHYDKLLKEADKYNVNFLAKPELLEKFPHAVEAAGVFVKDNRLNDYADRGDKGFKGYAGILNTGSPRKKANHYTERLALYEKAMAVIPDSFNLTGPTEIEIEERTPEPEVTEENTETNGVKVEVEGTNVSVETTNTAATPKEKVAVVAPKPTKWYSGLGAKITSAVTGNALFIWASDRLQSLVGIIGNPVFWYVIIGIVLVGTIIWLWNEARENSRKKDRDAELIKLSLEQNSTSNNYVQTIPHDEVELYRLRGYKIVPIGESVPQPSA